MLEDRRKNATNVCRLILTPLDEESAQFAVSFTEITADKMRELDVTIARTAVVLLPEALAEHYKFAMRLQKTAMDSLAAMGQVEEKVEKAEENWEKSAEGEEGKKEDDEVKGDIEVASKERKGAEDEKPSEELVEAPMSDIGLLVRARIREPQVYALEDVGTSNTRALMVGYSFTLCGHRSLHP